jgi:2-dehydropantoate 2-reductase
VIRHVYGDKFALGEPDGATSPRIQRIADVMEQAGFRAPVLDDIRSELWLKLWGNLCFNPISAITRGPSKWSPATRPAGRPRVR